MKTLLDHARFAASCPGLRRDERGSVKIFLSAVSGQFKEARNGLASDLRANEIIVFKQEDFQLHDSTLLEKLENLVDRCDRVIAIIGNAYGAEPTVTARPAQCA